MGTLRRANIDVVIGQSNMTVNVDGRLGPGTVKVASKFALSGAQPDEEIELGEDEMDVVFHDGAMIDLGAALTDTLALALDPYPRSPNAEAALKAAGVLSEEQAGPFAALTKLKGDKPDA